MDSTHCSYSRRQPLLDVAMLYDTERDSGQGYRSMMIEKHAQRVRVGPPITAVRRLSGLGPRRGGERPDVRRVPLSTGGRRILQPARDLRRSSGAVITLTGHSALA